MNTLQKGSESELAVAYELTKFGWLTSFPITHNSQYDLIVDVNGRLSKIQIKRAYIHSKQRENTLCVETRRIIVKHSGDKKTVTRKYDNNGYDFLIAHYPKNNEFWVLPFNVCDKYAAQVYLTTKNNEQYKGKWSLLGADVRS